jgi:cytidine deaminase
MRSIIQELTNFANKYAHKKKHNVLAGVISGSSVKLLSTNDLDRIICAETKLIRRVRNEYHSHKHFDIIVIKFNNEEKIKTSKPCKVCCRNLKKLNKLRYVYYFTNDEDMIKVHVNSLDNEKMTLGQVFKFN